MIFPEGNKEDVKAAVAKIWGETSPTAATHTITATSPTTITVTTTTATTTGNEPSSSSSSASPPTASPTTEVVTVHCVKHVLDVHDILIEGERRGRYSQLPLTSSYQSVSWVDCCIVLVWLAVCDGLCPLL